MGKKPEMSQVYPNEFVFSEKGGKGKNISTFLKNLSLTHKDYKEVNSNIYGSLSYKSSLDRSDSQSSQSNGGSGSHNSRPKSPKRSISGPNSFLSGIAPITSHKDGSVSPKKRIASLKYTDLDDDWDADLNTNKLNEEKDQSKEKFKGHGNTMKNSSIIVDSFFPDLSLSLDSPKQSIEDEDFKATIEQNKINQLNVKFDKFKAILTNDSTINIQELRKLSWNGIPTNLRPVSWQILLGYLPTNKSRQLSTLKTKRQEFIDGINATSIDFDEDGTSNFKDNSKEKQLYHQIKIDVKRTNPTIKLFASPQVQKSLRKILYFWAIRHPTSGYVQGINDLVTPFYKIFLGHYLWQLQNKDQTQLFIPGLMDDGDSMEQELLNANDLINLNIDNIDPSRLSERVHQIIEADSYWCLSKLLDTITDNYIHEQPGILKQVQDLKNLISKIDIDLINHFNSESIEFIQFSFRWMNCLLMRELSIDLIIRMWDTYLSENPLGFSSFHIYVCAAFLVRFSPQLKTMEFQDILIFLQNPPTEFWTEKDIELMLSEAFIWSSLYKNASAHLR
ncbi:GTPase-activating protein Gyp1p [[Candida] jaroonii]|uniref:GTPase-activating protein Gyp1p n=1 Tax=[Candida] jaroonii TaxID=467808 RepID=A0ACA9Y973_9ASCO|nr:GTPase-activating protein Gyp1p [[Candida] jaroonii]